MSTNAKMSEPKNLRREHKIVPQRRMDRGPQGAVEKGEGMHPAYRRIERGTAQTALGETWKELRLRRA